MPTPSSNLRRPRRLVTALAAFSVVLTLAACGGDGSDNSTPDPGTRGSSTTRDGGSTSGSGDPEGSVGTFKTVKVATLDQPVAMAVRPGDDDLWAVERTGKILRLTMDDDGNLEADGDPVLDLTAETTTDMERGILGLAFSNDGGTLYLSYTDVDGNTVIAAYEITEDDSGPTVDADEAKVLLTQTQPYENHNGGHLLVDGSGQLWLGLGDGGSGDDPKNNAQDPDTLLGKLIKVDLSGDEEHEIVSLGLRNPWRFAIDPQERVMWIADVGQNAIEEVNRIALDDLPGANFGWSGYEGNEPYLDGDGRRPEDPVMPVYTYTHEGQPGGCSVTGGVVYRGAELAGLDGAYLIADFCAGWVQALLAAEDGTVKAVDLGIEVPGAASFASDADGRVYVLSLEGPVVRIDPA